METKLIQIRIYQILQTCWTWVPIGSALKIYACTAPVDHDDGDFVDFMMIVDMIELN